MRTECVGFVSMISFLKRLWSDRRGNALVVAGAALPLVVGSVGLASDTIQWALWKRQLQRSADSAAIAGVYAIVDGKTVGGCSNVASATFSDPVAWDVKNNNRLSNGNPTCTVSNPPNAGGYTTNSNAVRVTLTTQKVLGFSSMFMSAAPTITATATAAIVPTGKYCVIALEDGNETGIDATGSTTVNLGCGMITNATSMQAAVATGSSSVTASPIAAVGGIPASTHWGTGTVLQPFTVQQPDPFANKPVPTPSNCGGFPANQPNDTVTVANPTGVRCFNSDMNIKGNVTLEPGVYVLDGASVSMSNTGAKLNCTGCTIILTGSPVGGVSIEGGQINMSSPTSGTYKGMLFYQDRNAALLNTIKINGNSDSVIEGALYFPQADMTYNGTSGQNTACMQLVSRRVTFTGNSAISNTCPSTGGGSSFDGQSIRLVE